jgi:hypothetical protein
MLVEIHSISGESLRSTYPCIPVGINILTPNSSDTLELPAVIHLNLQPCRYRYVPSET